MVVAIHVRAVESLEVPEREKSPRSDRYSIQSSEWLDKEKLVLVYADLP